VGGFRVSNGEEAEFSPRRHGEPKPLKLGGTEEAEQRKRLDGHRLPELPKLKTGSETVEVWRTVWIPSVREKHEGFFIGAPLRCAQACGTRRMRFISLTQRLPVQRASAPRAALG